MMLSQWWWAKGQDWQKIVASPLSEMMLNML